MQNTFRNFYKSWIFSFLCFLLILVSFQANIFHIARSNEFQDFEKYSAALIAGKIAADKYNIDTPDVNLGYISEGKWNRREATREGFSLLESESVNVSELQFRPYNSQYGLQGKIYSALYNHFPKLSIKDFEFINSFLLATIIFCLYLCYTKIFDRKFALLFLVTCSTSHWLIILAKNIYWLPFTWFLPALFAALAYQTRNKLFYILVFLSFFIKCLTGYEYITSVTLFACSFCLIAPFFSSQKVQWKSLLKEVLIIFMSCVSAFFAAVLVHASMIGNSNLLVGLQLILSTAQRRTFGIAENARNLRQQLATDASPWSVLETYIFQWERSAFLGIPGQVFSVLLLICLVSLVIKLFSKKNYWNKHYALFFVSISAPASWFFLAKEHSYIHTHMNFVLWYFGFIVAMLYIISDDLAMVMQWLSGRMAWCKRRKPNQIP